MDFVRCVDKVLNPSLFKKCPYNDDVSLAGTPIQNSVKDLWMLMAFLRLKPFNVRDWWNRVIQRPVTLGDRAGLE